MKYAEFETLLDAQIYRKNHGGWIFITDRSEAIWYSLTFTPSMIFVHRATRGRSGRLI